MANKVPERRSLGRDLSFEEAPEKKAITNCFDVLCNNVDIKQILPTLVAKRLVNMTRCKELQVTADTDVIRANTDLLMTIADVPEKVRIFCEALLCNSATEHIGTRLREELIECGCEMLPGRPKSGASAALADTTVPLSAAAIGLEQAVKSLHKPKDPQKQDQLRRALSSKEPTDEGDTVTEETAESVKPSNRLPSVKVTNLSKDQNRYHLSSLLEVQGLRAHFSHIKLVQGGVLDLNHAFVVCTSSSNASVVAEFLNGRSIGQQRVAARVCGLEASRPAAHHVTVKVSHVPKDFSKDRLSHLLRKVKEVVEVSIQETDQELNYAWVNCEDKASAERVVNKLNGASVGRDKTMLVARLRHHDSDKVSLKVSFLPKHIEESELKKAVDNIDEEASVSILRVCDQDSNYGYINCSNAISAEEIEANLDGLEIAGHRLMVRRQNKQTGAARQKVKSQEGAASLDGHYRPGKISVKVSFLPHFSEPDFVELRRKVSAVKSATFHQTHCFLVFHCHEDALSACDQLLGLGYKARLA